jgi:flagellar protein FlbD
MILLTRLNSQPIVVNSDMIKFIENTPDTVITLLTGEKIVVRETVPQVLDEMLRFRRHACSGPGSFAKQALEIGENAEGN